MKRALVLTGLTLCAASRHARSHVKGHVIGVQEKNPKRQSSTPICASA